jgi:short-subunit dehydrogenase
MNSVIIGGTAGVGREIANALAVRGHNLLITGKDERDVDTCVANLRIRYGVKVSGLAVDATSHENYLITLKDAAAQFGTIDNLFIPNVSSNQLDNGGLGVQEIAAIFSSNFMSVVLAVKVLSEQFHKTERVTIIGFSSIAAIRGRSENVIYSASKKAL